MTKALPFKMDPQDLAAAYLAAPYGALIVDNSGKIIACNKRAARIVAGLREDRFEKLLGEDLAALLGLDPEDLKRMLREGAAIGWVELPMRRGAANLPHKSIRFRAGLIRSPTPGEYRVMLTQDHLQVVAQTLADKNRAREKARAEVRALNAQSKKLSKSLHTMEAFTQAASHDLRTPLGNLTVLLGLFEQRYSADLPPRALELLEAMRTASDQLFQQTECLLDYARATSGAFDMQLVDLRQVVESVVCVLQSELDAAGGTVTLPGETAQIQAEPNLLRTVLMNLLSNAIKYRSGDRALEIKVGLTPSSISGLTLSVADNGRGFDPALAGRIFEPFERLTSEGTGSGIGLATCMEICRRHGWVLRADAIPAMGARFTIEIAADLLPA